MVLWSESRRLFANVSLVSHGELAAWSFVSMGTFMPGEQRGG